MATKTPAPTLDQVNAFMAEHDIEVTTSGAVLFPWGVKLDPILERAVDRRAGALYKAWVAAGKPTPERLTSFSA